MADSDLDARVAWQQHLGHGPVADRWYESVVARYSEAHRRYHDMRHVRWVIRHVLALAADHVVVDLGAIIAAAFFHDVVYDPTAHDNEAVSARLAGDALRELGWPADRIATVAAMIEGTAQHDHTEVDVDTAVLFAADLAVLAAEPAGYGDYVRNVRHEYGHVDAEQWTAGRSDVLRRFLARSAIYAPWLSLDAWERRARANLAAELATLGR